MAITPSLQIKLFHFTNKTAHVICATLKIRNIVEKFISGLSSLFFLTWAVYFMFQKLHQKRLYILYYWTRLKVKVHILYKNQKSL